MLYPISGKYCKIFLFEPSLFQKTELLLTNHLITSVPQSSQGQRGFYAVTCSSLLGYLEINTIQLWFLTHKPSHCFRMLGTIILKAFLPIPSSNFLIRDVKIARHPKTIRMKPVCIEKVYLLTRHRITDTF